MTINVLRAPTFNVLRAPTFDEIVASQAGVVTREQALASGLTPGAIKWKIERGIWRRLDHGIYATFNGPLPEASRRWAAVLRCGSEVALSHQTAARVWGLSDSDDRLIHISVPNERHLASRKGTMVHRTLRFPESVHPARQPPVTRVEETALDLAHTARNIDEAVAWLAAACQRRLTTPERLMTAAQGRPVLRGRDMLMGALTEVRLGCHSVLELKFLKLVEQGHALPAGQRQYARIDSQQRRRSYDIYYERWKLMIELDGRIAHSLWQLPDDRRRDNAAAVDGVTVLRFGWGDVVDHPCRTAGQVGAALATAGWSGTPRRCSDDCQLGQTMRTAVCGR